MPGLGAGDRRTVRRATVRRALLAAAGVVGLAVLAGCAPPVAAAPPTSSPVSPPAAAPTATGLSTVVSPESSADPSPVVAVVPSNVPATAVTAPAPGTGSAADRIAAETVFRTYLHAVVAGDFATACSLNAPETNQRLIDELTRRGTPATTCEQAIATLYAGSGVARGAAAIATTLSVQRVDVDGDAATVAWSVEVSGQRPVVTNALRRIDGQWRLLPTPDPAG